MFLVGKGAAYPVENFLYCFVPECGECFFNSLYSLNSIMVMIERSMDLLLAYNGF